MSNDAKTGPAASLIGRLSQVANRFLAVPVAVPMFRADIDAWRHLNGLLAGRKPAIGQPIGLIESVDALATSRFRPEKLDPVIRDFYERTSEYKMEATVRWSSRWISEPYYWISNLFLQLRPGRNEYDYVPLENELVSASLARYGIDNPSVRIWRRLIGTDKVPFYTAVCRTFIVDDFSYLQVIVPYFWGNFAVVFELQNEPSGGLILNASQKHDAGPLAGNWMTSVVLGKAAPAVRAPGADGEKIAVLPYHLKTAQGLRGEQEGFGFGKQVFRIDYRIAHRDREQVKQA